MTTYEPSRAGWGQIANSPDMLQACMAEAERGLAWATENSPVETGSYASAWRTAAASVVIGSRWGPRVAAELWNDSSHAAAVEFGNSNSGRGQHVAARTAEFLGA